MLHEVPQMIALQLKIAVKNLPLALLILLLPPMFSQATQLDFLMPLQFFYAHAGLEMPHIHFLPGLDMPEPQKFLLVHASDMTPRLRDFHSSPITLEVVTSQAHDSYVMRLVVLHKATDDRAIEIGAIGIDLTRFLPEDQERIRSGAAPLGGILQERNIPHQSHPKAYFKIVTDDYLAKLLREAPGQVRYGRCNALAHPDGIVFADIVEILPAEMLD